MRPPVRRDEPSLGLKSDQPFERKDVGVVHGIDGDLWPEEERDLHDRERENHRVARGGKRRSAFVARAGAQHQSQVRARADSGGAE